MMNEKKPKLKVFFISKGKQVKLMWVIINQNWLWTVANWEGKQNDRRYVSIKFKDNLKGFLTVQEEKKPLTGASTLLSRKRVEYEALKQRNQ